MRSEEEIINRIEWIVEECSYYNKDNTPYCCEVWDNECEAQNCYYKQLKRKEQECNKLYIQLKADEEYHKEEKKTLRKIIKNKEERNIELYKENNKLKQTLTEIKPILEFYANSKMGEEHPDKTYHIMLNGSCIMVYDPKPARQAIQKISEVENDR